MPPRESFTRHENVTCSRSKKSVSPIAAHSSLSSSDAVKPLDVRILSSKQPLSAGKR